MTKNFPKLMLDTKAYIREAQRTLGRINDKNKERKQQQETLHFVV